jgi:hypothetical protein
MKFSLEGIPFSRYGSYFVLSCSRRDKRIYIRDLHGGDEAPSQLFALSVPDADEFTVTGTESAAEVRLDGDRYAAFAISPDGDTIHISLHGMKLRLDMTGSRYDSIVPQGASRWEAFFYKKNRKIMFSCLKGECQRFGAWALVGDRDGGMILNSGGGDCHVVLDNYRAAWTPKEYMPFKDAVQSAQDEYDSWKRGLKLPEGDESAELACYLLWANFVRAEGALPYDALYCSKNWMNNIWSWDNCFMAVALSEAYPQKAYEQLKTFFPLQDDSGCYPDYANDVYAAYSCCKPPIHAWAYRKMREINEKLSERETLSEAYESFKKVAAYWLERRVPEGASLPVYNHGNDSGWDNASVFHEGVPVCSPDLAAHLIRQLDILAGFAAELGRDAEAAEMTDKADKTFAALMRDNFDGQRFYAVHTPTGKRITEGDSLLMYIPVVIGYRLPKAALDFIVKEMLDKFEAPYGLCTENPKNGKYKKGGYWLGPIWAPVTYLIIDALRENGYASDAKRLADKFIKLPKIGLMAENFDAFTGEGYDDPAFSWTSAVYLRLLKEFR